MDVSYDERVFAPRGAGWLAVMVIYGLAAYGGRGSPGTPVPA